MEQTNSYGRIMIRKQMKLHNNLVQTAAIQVDDQIDERVEKQMMVFHAAQRYKESYNVMQKRQEDDLVLSKLIDTAQSACDTKLSAHTIRFKQFRATKPTWEPSWLQRTEEAMSMRTHEKSIMQARAKIDAGLPKRAIHFKKVLNKSRYTRGGFPRVRKKRFGRYATVPAPTTMPPEGQWESGAEPAPPETEIEIEAAPPETEVSEKVAETVKSKPTKPKPTQARQQPKKKPAEKRKNPRRVIEDRDCRTLAAPAPMEKSSVRMHTLDLPPTEFNEEDWVQLRDWLWNFGRVFVTREGNNFPAQLLHAAESMNKIQDVYNSNVEALSREASRGFLKAALLFLLQQAAKPEENTEQQIKLVKESGCPPALLMHLKKLQQFSKCLDRPELPPLKASDKPAIAHHVFGVAAVLQDRARELQAEGHKDLEIDQEEPSTILSAEDTQVLPAVTASPLITQEGEIAEELPDDGAREEPPKEFVSHSNE